MVATTSCIIPSFYFNQKITFFRVSNSGKIKSRSQKENALNVVLIRFYIFWGIKEQKIHVEKSVFFLYQNQFGKSFQELSVIAILKRNSHHMRNFPFLCG
jgi:hypothetical protein